MNYLCMAVQREVTKKEGFGSREQAQEYFWENFGSLVTERLEAEKKKLEGRLRYYDRREQRGAVDERLIYEPQGAGSTGAGADLKAAAGRTGKAGGLLY